MPEMNSYNDDNEILPDFSLLSSEQIEGWLVIYARAMVNNTVDDLPAKLIEFVQSDPKMMVRLNDIYDQITIKPDSFKRYHLVASDIPVVRSNHQPPVVRKIQATHKSGYGAIAAVVLIFLLSFLAVYLYVRPEIEPTEILAMQNKIDSLNKEITLLQIKNLQEKSNFAIGDSPQNTSNPNPSVSKDENAFFAAQKIKFHHQFQPDQTKELMIAEAFASRGVNEPTTENPFKVKVFSPDQRVINQVNFQWEVSKDKKKYTESLRFRLYNNQKKLKDIPLANSGLQLNDKDGLTDGLYYWTLETDDQQIFIGKFEFFTK